MIDLLRKIKDVQVFEDVERRTSETERNLNLAILDLCQAYQVSGYLAGVNDGIKLAGTIGNTKIEIQDLETGKKLI
jgi:hypothetical protein